MHPRWHATIISRQTIGESYQCRQQQSLPYESSESSRSCENMGALSEDTAVPESTVPYSDRWYYRRLVRYGAVRQIGDKCYPR